ncbi:unnamed protein product, partial [Tuber aestivum]
VWQCTTSRCKRGERIGCAASPRPWGRGECSGWLVWQCTTSRCK